MMYNYVLHDNSVLWTTVFLSYSYTGSKKSCHHASKLSFLVNLRRACARVTVLVNPRRACARVTVLVLSVCLSVCLCVCVCVFPILAPRAIRRTNSSISDFSAIRA